MQCDAACLHQQSGDKAVDPALWCVLQCVAVCLQGFAVCRQCDAVCLRQQSGDNAVDPALWCVL